MIKLNSPLRTFAAAAVLWVLLPVNGFSQFGIPGIPTIVFDPDSYATLGTIWSEDVSTGVKILQEIAQLVKIYNNAVQIYDMATRTYNQIAYSAGWTPLKSPWLGSSIPIVLSTTRTIFGETAGWNGAVSGGGLGIPGAWGAATYGINPPPFYAGYPIGNSSISANIASIMLADGMSQAAMQSIANSRGNQPLNDIAIFSLEFASQDTSPDTNSEVEQLNQINSGNVLMNRQAEDGNALLTTIAEQQILGNKIMRDALASNLNVMTARDNAIANESIGWGGDAALFASYSQ